MSTIDSAFLSPLASIFCDYWMEEKKKLDGAEQLWRIHDKLYDFTVWSRIHPGGKFWIDTTRGTDITEAFESHHLSDKAESLLKKFYKREAAILRRSSATFAVNGFFSTFKRRVHEKGITFKTEPSSKNLLLSDVLVAAFFLTAIPGNYWTLICGVILGMLLISTHNFIHTKPNWRVNYINLSLMSSREWKIKHVLSHHQYRGTDLDIEQPILNNFPKNNLIRGTFQLMALAFSAHMQFFKRFLDVFLSRKLGFDPEDLIGFCLPLFLYVFTHRSLWNVFVLWNWIILVGSFTFCVFNSTWTKQNYPIGWKQNSIRNEKDYGITQVLLTKKESSTIFSFLDPSRKNPLHYLCPTIPIERLDQLHPVLEITCQEFGISSKQSTSELEHLLDACQPESHVFFS